MNYKDLIYERENEADIIGEWLFDRIRQWRDHELALCDWTQVADSTADKASWATYRQELRDLPAQNADPKLIVFPTRPE
jgi:hypothetical protein